MKNLRCPNVISPASKAADPRYDESQRRVSGISVVRDSTFNIQGFWSVSAESLERVWAQRWDAKGLRLYVIGYVDYLDRFGGRHRSGYGRVWEPNLDDKGSRLYRRNEIYQEDLYQNRSNLPFMPLPRYNYDRPRTPGEGDDWEWHPPVRKV